MAPATLESASPIGIANVSLNSCHPRLLNADEFVPASKPAVRFQQAMWTDTWRMLTSLSDTRLSPNEERRLLLWWVAAQIYRNQPIDAKTTQVAGESGLGKTTFINTLFSTTIKNYADHKRRHAKQVDKTVEIEITKAELEEKFFKGTLYQFNYNAMFV
jgi:hypothetical protein